jgi:hypothetical protein
MPPRNGRDRDDRKAVCFVQSRRVPQECSSHIRRVIAMSIATSPSAELRLGVTTSLPRWWQVTCMTLVHRGIRVIKTTRDISPTRLIRKKSHTASNDSLLVGCAARSCREAFTPVGGFWLDNLRVAVRRLAATSLSSIGTRKFSSTHPATKVGGLNSPSQS